MPNLIDLTFFAIPDVIAFYLTNKKKSLNCAYQPLNFTSAMKRFALDSVRVGCPVEKSEKEQTSGGSLQIHQIRDSSSETYH